MKQTIAILFFALVLSVKAEEFNWSWEKTAGSGKATEGRGQKTGGDSSSSNQPSAVDLQNSVSNITPSSISNPPSAFVNRESSGSVPDSVDKLPAVSGAVTTPVSNGNFSWTWENKNTKTDTGKGEGKNAEETAKHPLVQPSALPAPFPEKMASEKNPGSAKLPPEIENLTGAVPGSSGQLTSQYTNVASLPVSVPVPPVQKPEDVNLKPATGGSIDAKAYDELIRENLDLHKKISEAKLDKDLMKLENERLAKEIKDLEERISDSVVKIKDLGKQKESSTNSPVGTRELEIRLIKAEQEKMLLNNQLSVLQKKISDQGKIVGDQTPGIDVRQAAGVNKPAEPVRIGSDLYKKLESENLLLRQKLSELDAERQKAVKAREETEKREKLASEEAKRAVESQKQIKEKLDEAKIMEKKQKKMISDLVERIPDMEKEMTALNKKLSEKDVVLKERDRNLEILANEVHQRENRIRKAEKMVELMEQAQKDVNQVSDSEKRDMHYNMAAVYSQVGRFRDAEREYLHALRLDPTDADVHYNLGILYDDNLNEKQKAAMHYRRYLKLRPNGPDVDAVKNWLINIDMKQ
jgi:tetratricopeptide (TPR) repeat protein